MTKDYKKLWDIKLKQHYLSADNVAYMNFIHQFADFTKTMITQGKLDIAQRCFIQAERIFVHGDKQFKKIFTYAFFSPLSLAIAYSHCENLIPLVLKNELYSYEIFAANERAENIDEL